jgi:arabinose-5-phosphate isomerase
MNSPKEYIEVAKEVLKTESNAILEMAKKLDNSFYDAVEAIRTGEGRVIVSGMGKPGIIGRKIQATLASIGIPSLSLHPAEAIHGDLGVVTKEDIILALSYSGETDEMLKLIPVVKKIGAFLISLTGHTGSTLAKHSDIVLDVGVSREACPLNLAPTSSTTAMLAMGDAIAVALIQKKGLKAEDFALFHPGGSLGRKLLKVKDVMRSGNANPIVREETGIKEVLIKITEARAGAAAVVNKDGELVGIFTDGDLRRAVEEHSDLSAHKIRDYMIKSPITIEPEKLAVEALKIMSGANLKKRKLDELPVVDKNGYPIGMLDIVDLISIS